MDNTNIKQQKGLIAYGSKSGHSKKVAIALQKTLAAHNTPVACQSLSDLTIEELRSIDRLWVVISTYGDGTPPPKAKAFFKALRRSVEDLSHLHYSICALGDRRYKHFCQAGRDLETLFEAQKAIGLMPRVECDKQYAKPAGRWISAVLKGLALGQGADEKAAIGLADGEGSPELKGRIKLRERLNHKRCSQACYHIVIKSKADLTAIRPGDAIEVTPTNPPWLVKKTARLLDGGSDKKTIRQLKYKKEITTVSLCTLESYAHAFPHPLLTQLLEQKAKLEVFLAQANLLDVLQLFPPGSTGSLLKLLPPLGGRLYSVASSPEAKSNELHLTVKAVRFGYRQQRHEGAGSILLTERLKAGRKIRFRHVPNQDFRLPDPAAPIVMVGVGTGIAPFRAFLQQKEAHGHINTSWLIWGDKQENRDFLYRKHLRRLLKNKVLGRMDVAFSRDGTSKTYVQDILWSRKEEVLAWLHKGAHIYVCGSSQMAGGVRRTLREILHPCQRYPQLDYASLLQQNRYHEDAY